MSEDTPKAARDKKVLTRVAKAAAAPLARLAELQGQLTAAGFDKEAERFGRGPAKVEAWAQKHAEEATA